MILKKLTKTEDDTRKLGEEISKIVPKGSSILIYGDLGAGKTVISSGLVKGYTKKQYSVTSPTFTIVQEYYGETGVYHFDLYRLDSLAELENIGVYEYLFDENAVCLIEWPERAEELESLLNEVYKLEIKKIDEFTREIVLEKIKG